MKPLKLTMRAFGPFPDEQTIDFESLGPQPFFLIHGPTGAGKTTILDAICFALYGAASGTARAPAHFRSTGAPPGAVCEVEFRFRAGGRFFHVKRVPAQTVPSPSGGGKTRNLPHTVEFCEVDQQGAVVGKRLSKVKEVTDAVEGILGFTSDQFRQVVVLPQGEFRTLLFANSTMKEELLKKLFGTRLYERIEEILKSKAASLRKELETLETQRKAVLSVFLQGVDAPTVEMLATAVRELSERHEQAARAHAGKKAALAIATEAETRGRDIAARFDALAKAEQVAKDLAARKKTHEDEKERLEAARRAASLADAESNVSTRREELAAAARDAESLGEAICVLREKLKETAPRLAALVKCRSKIPEWSKKLNATQTRRDRLVELATLEGGLASSARTAATLQAAAKAAEKAWHAASARRESLEKRVSELNDQIASGKPADLEALRGRLRARKALDDDTASLLKAGHAQLSLSNKVVTLEKRVEAARAAVLATSLVDGKPCPVCGSTDHPAPAAHRDGASGLDSLLGELSDTRNKFARKGEDTGRLEGTINAARSRLGQDAGRPIKELESELTATEQKEAERDEAKAELSESRKAKSEASRVETASETERHKAAAAAAKASGEVGEKTKLVAETKRKVGRGENDIDKLDARVRELTAWIAEVEDELPRIESAHTAKADELKRKEGEKGNAEAAVESRKTAAEKASTAFEDRRRKAGFDSLKTYGAAKLDADDTNNLKRRVDTYDNASKEASGRLKAAQERCTGHQRPDLASLTTARDGLAGEAESIGKTTADLDRQVEDRRKALDGLAKAAAKNTKVEAEYLRLNRLASVTRGDNRSNINLQRFVLATLLDEVVAKASVRLQTMSRGRFHLQREFKGSDGRKSAGLDLRVLDEFSGGTRPVNTLSGGETFLASLSLALGLADVVVSASAGRYLETLFIDEGFGTLDAETLETAMTTLMSLHRSGRTIGLISHVAELKERIAARIEIVQNRAGSEIRIVAGL
jgi:exonuclease SbcC